MQFRSIILFLLLPVLPLQAQQPENAKTRFLNYTRNIRAGVVVPAGSFSTTHWGGITGSYSCLFTRKKSKAMPKTGWTVQGAISYFSGKKESLGLIHYHYPGYTLLDIGGGFSWIKVHRLQFDVLTGPAIGHYSGSFRFSWAGSLQTSYRLTDKMNISPSLRLVKEKGAATLWIAALKAGILF